MFNRTLYLRGLMGSWKLIVILGATLAMYFAIIITMFNPEMNNVLDEFAKMMPEMMAMVGMDQSSNTLIGFMSSYLYGFIMLVFPMVFSILCANKLIARHVDGGSMTYLLAAPVKRVAVAFTQMKVLVTGIIILVLFATGLSIVTCEIYYPGELEIGKFLLLNVGVLCLHLFIGGICFLCSCFFSDTKYSVGFGAGIPSLAFVIEMLANTGKEMENAKYATFFTLFNPNAIIDGETSSYLGIAVLFVGALVLFVSAVIVFTRKDLHI